MTRVLFLGTRGLPPRYGGRETATDEIARRLLTIGHFVTVYGRGVGLGRRTEMIDGIEQVLLPTVGIKGLDSLVHVLASSLDLILTGRRGVVILSDVGTAIAIPLLLLAGYPTIWWVDGPAWERSKWGWGARTYLRLCAWLGIHLANEVVVDSRVAAAYYSNRFGRTTHFIPYGPTVANVSNPDVLSELGLVDRQFVLFVGRLTPEKGVHHLLEAFTALETDSRLVIVGDNPYDRGYVEGLRATADTRVIFAGYQFGDRFAALMRNCSVYVQPSEVEGTSPVLLAAMGCGRPVIVQGIAENLETIGDAGLAFRPGAIDQLRSHLRALLGSVDLREEWGERARSRVRKEYDWDQISEDFARVCETLASKIG